MVAQHLGRQHVTYVYFIYLFIYLRTQHSKQYKIEDTIKAAKF